MGGVSRLAAQHLLVLALAAALLAAAAAQAPAPAAPPELLQPAGAQAQHLPQQRTYRIQEPGGEGATSYEAVLAPSTAVLAPPLEPPAVLRTPTAEACSAACRADPRCDWMRWCGLLVSQVAGPLQRWGWAGVHHPRRMHETLSLTGARVTGAAPCPHSHRSPCAQPHTAGGLRRRRQRHPALPAVQPAGGELRAAGAGAWRTRKRHLGCGWQLLACGLPCFRRGGGGSCRAAASRPAGSRLKPACPPRAARPQASRCSTPRPPCPASFRSCLG